MVGLGVAFLEGWKPGKETCVTVVFPSIRAASKFDNATFSAVEPITKDSGLQDNG